MYVVQTVRFFLSPYNYPGNFNTKYKDFGQKAKIIMRIYWFWWYGESFLGYRTNSLLIQWERQENLLLSPTWMVKIWWRGDFCLSQQFHKQLKTIQGGTATVLTCICTSATSAALALALSWPCSETIHWSHTHTKLVLRKKNNLPPV